jgi:hypothetical protein
MPGQAAGESPGFIAPMLATAVAALPPTPPSSWPR